MVEEWVCLSWWLSCGGICSEQLVRMEEKVQEVYKLDDSRAKHEQ